MYEIHKHRDPQTLTECADALEAVAKLSPLMQQTARVLRDNSVPINNMPPLESAGEVLSNVCLMVEHLLEKARKQALADMKAKERQP